MKEKFKKNEEYIISIIIFVIAVIFLIFGIKGILNVSEEMKPKMSDPNWYDRNVEYNKMKFAAIIQLSLGIFFSFFTLFSFISIRIKKKTRIISSIVTESIKDSYQAQKMVKCEYCGAKFVGDTCPGCGARR